MEKLPKCGASTGQLRLVSAQLSPTSPMEWSLPSSRQWTDQGSSNNARAGAKTGCKGERGTLRLLGKRPAKGIRHKSRRQRKRPQHTPRPTDRPSGRLIVPNGYWTLSRIRSGNPNWILFFFLYFLSVLLLPRGKLILDDIPRSLSDLQPHHYFFSLNDWATLLVLLSVSFSLVHTQTRPGRYPPDLRLIFSPIVLRAAPEQTC